MQVRGLKEGNERVSFISRELADLWREHGVAAIVLAQLNRGLESRDDRRPMLSDLHNSGQIEQDADGVIFLHREDYFHLDEADYQPTGIAELIVAKWRDGAAAGSTLRLISNLKLQRFDELPLELRAIFGPKEPAEPGAIHRTPRRPRAVRVAEWTVERFGVGAEAPGPGYDDRRLRCSGRFRVRACDTPRRSPSSARCQTPMNPPIPASARGPHPGAAAAADGAQGRTVTPSP